LSLPDHLLVDRFCDREEATDVGIDHLVPRAISSSSKVIAAVDGRVIHENIDPAPLLHDLTRDSFQSEPVSNRNFETEGASAVSLNLGPNGLSEIVATVIVENYVCAFPRENLANRGANPAGSSAYERALSFKQ